MARRWSLRRALLVSLIGALLLSALVGIYIFVVGDFGETEIKILVTTLSLAYFSVCALGCAVAMERGRTRWLTYPGLVSCAFGFVWSLLLIWAEWYREPEYVVKTMVIAVIAAFSLAQSSLLTLAPLRGRWRWAFGSTLAAIFALATLVSVMLVFELDDELLFRLAGVLGILDATGTLAVPILYKLGYAVPATPRPAGQAQPATSWQIELACPRCGHRGAYPAGRIRCPGCSLEIQVGVVEPAQATPRRPFQFTLRSLLVLMLLISLPLGWIGYRLRERSKQAQAVAALKAHGASVYSQFGNARSVTIASAGGLDADLAQLKNLPRLESLALRNMPVTDKDLRYLEHLHLTYLDLAYTKVTDAGLNSLATLRQLRSLNAEGTRITPQGIQTLRKAIPGLYVNMGAPKSLPGPERAVAALKEGGASVYSSYDGSVPVVVFADRVRFDPSALAELRNLPRVERVELRSMPLADQDLRHLENLELMDLGLAYTSVTDAGLNSVATMRGLRDLDLEGTRVSDAGLKSLARLTRLRELDVRGTAVTPQGIQGLTRAIPGLQVHAGPPERVTEAAREKQAADASPAQAPGIPRAQP